jgi:DNA-directed RNA polymerase specialized sigma24 family protein
MAVARKSEDKHEIGLETAVVGVLTLLVDARERAVKDDKEAAKTEVLLSKAGLSIADIATLLGKKYDTVKISLQRSRAK